MGQAVNHPRAVREDQPGSALNQPVNKTQAVNRETGEFGGLSEANGLNHDG